MPRLAKTKKKTSEKEGSGDGDGSEAILSVGVGESTSLNMQRRSPTTARTKSKVGGSKKKTSKAANSTSEEPPSPESGGRKCSPEQLVALEKQKGKVTTLWQRGKPKRVVVSDVPLGKDTGPPPNKNSISFCKQFPRILILTSTRHSNQLKQTQLHMMNCVTAPTGRGPRRRVV